MIISGGVLASPTLEKPLSVIESSKRLAAWTAVDRHVLPEHKVRYSASVVWEVILIDSIQGNWNWFRYGRTTMLLL